MLVAKLYAYIYLFIKKIFSINLPGLGFLLRRVKKSTYVKILGLELYFNPGAASSYGLNIIGKLHEPETHLFLNTFIDSLNSKSVAFIEVGANIGIFLLDLSRKENLNLFGFEPSSHCIDTIRMTFNKNKKNSLRLFQNLVGDKNDFIPIEIGKHDGSASVFSSNNSSSIVVEQISIDDQKILFDSIHKDHILMIDVEGYEVNVLKGASVFISNKQPLIIFEYNHISKKHFSLNDIIAILGLNYKIYRLNKNGFLDNQTENAWNCVAVPDRYNNLITHNNFLDKCAE